MQLNFSDSVLFLPSQSKRIRETLHYESGMPGKLFKRSDKWMRCDLWIFIMSVSG